MVGTRSSSSLSTIFSKAFGSYSFCLPSLRSLSAPMWKPDEKLLPVPVMTSTRIDTSLAMRS